MARGLTTAPFDGRLADHLRNAPAQGGGLRLFWLGQAGFLVEGAGRRILLDPYLSDTLGAKYARTPFPHQRLMPPPVEADALEGIDLVLCTHRHTDHMDPGTLKPLAARLSGLRFVVPAAETAEALARTGAPDGRILPVDAGGRVEPLPGLVVRAVRAAHETLETDAEGRHRFLGYALSLGGVTLFHSGDTVPFEGQAREVAALEADVALLPVNGRSPDLAAAGFAGNMTIGEAASLCRDAGIPAMIAHHYGLFAFNTADPDTIDAAARTATQPRIERARLGTEYRLAPGSGIG